MKPPILSLCFLILLAPLFAGAEDAKPGAAADLTAYYLRPGDTVLFLGDSITAESKYYFKIFFQDIGSKYPELILVNGQKPKYGPVFKGASLTFVNGGVSGETAAGGLKRLPALLAQWKPTVCVVCYGMNDRYKDRAGYDANMKAIVEMLKTNKIAVTILTSPNVGSIKHPPLKPFVSVLGEMAQEMKALAAEEGVLYADCYTPTKAKGDDAGADLTWGDGIHPNETGHRIMADALETVWGFGKPLAKAGDPAPR